MTQPAPESGTEGAECSAYNRNGSICANGFIQTYPCWSEQKCSCGRHLGVPHCMKDELPEHWLNDDGSPRFYALSAAQVRL